MTEDGSSRQTDGSAVSTGAGRAGISGSTGRLGVPIGPRKRVAPSGPHSRWPQYVQYLLVVGMTALFLLLAVSMQQHHFLSGEDAKFQSTDH